MKLKTIEVDGKQYAEIREGKPLYISDDGKETAYDPVAMHATIGRLNNESKTHREAKEALEQKMQGFDGLDAEAARKALETIKNFDDKKLIDAGEVKRVKDETAAAYEARLKQIQQESDTLKTQYATEKLSNAFTGSKYVQDRMVVPPEMLQAAFSRHFEFKDGKILPKDANGNPIYSETSPGDIATFDEALEKIVSQYPHRDRILKPNGHGGSGTQALDEGRAYSRVVTRKQFEAMRPQQQAEIAKASSEGKVQIVN